MARAIPLLENASVDGGDPSLLIVDEIDGSLGTVRHWSSLRSLRLTSVMIRAGGSGRCELLAEAA
jgi:hypothetical protein